MRLSGLLNAIVSIFSTNNETPKIDRPMSTPEDIIWHRREYEAMRRDARMLGIDVDLEKAGR